MAVALVTVSAASSMAAALVTVSAVSPMAVALVTVSVSCIANGSSTCGSVSWLYHQWQ